MKDIEKFENSSKEETLRKHIQKYYYHKGRLLNNDDILPVSRILPAMDEYAKQEAIEFHRWIQTFGERFYKTTEQLYNLFLESKKQKSK